MTTDNKILVVICGIGNPGVSTKIKSCISNIKILEKTLPTKYKNKIDFKIFCYDNTIKNEFEKFRNCEVIKQNGIVGEFIFRNLNPSLLVGYDYLILMLDDIELVDDFNLKKLISIQSKHMFDILSPSATISSKLTFPFMKKRLDKIYKNKVLSVNFLEFFFYMFDLKNMNSYSKWYSLFDKNTRWMWGIDLLLHKVLKFKLGIVNNMSFIHTKLGGSNNKSAYREISHLEKKFNCKLIPGSGYNVLKVLI